MIYHFTFWEIPSFAFSVHTSHICLNSFVFVSFILILANVSHHRLLVSVAYER